MKKFTIFACAFLFAGMGAFASETETEENSSSSTFRAPGAGRFSIGLRFNPIAAAKSSDMVDDAAGDFVGNSIENIEDKAAHPNQMFFLTQDPMVSIQGKYSVSNNMSVRASVGFGGGVLNYREYVTDDAAKAVNSITEKVVTDKARASYTNGGVQAGIEFNTSGRLRFVGGVGLVYAWGGGEINYEYGNQMTIYNRCPTTMEKIEDMNEFVANPQMDYARPVKQYNIGVSHAFGFSLDMGVEWFFVKQASIGARLSIIPVMYAVQPQTYTTYEGYNKYTNSVEEYNHLVSKGSEYLLYGTDNLSLSFSLNYYF